MRKQRPMVFRNSLTRLPLTPALPIIRRIVRPLAISIGTKPTFNEATGMNDRVVEAYAITDDWLDSYDHQVRVEFTGFLRPQIKFDSAQDLIDELKRNVEETKRITA